MKKDKIIQLSKLGSIIEGMFTEGNYLHESENLYVFHVPFINLVQVGDDIETHNGLLSVVESVNRQFVCTLLVDNSKTMRDIRKAEGGDFADQIQSGLLECKYRNRIKTNSESDSVKMYRVSMCDLHESE